MKGLLVVAVMIAAGVSSAQAQAVHNQISIPANYRCNHFVPPGSLAPSDESYGKHLAAQYNTDNGG